MTQNHDSSNILFQLATSFVNHTHRHVFLTGKAGTGKTTFLHHVKNTTAKKAVVVAPTGVAAINAKGVTIHSFFQLPLGMYSPKPVNVPENLETNQVFDRQYLVRKLRINENKRKLIRELELLIIDEVSMVRADMLDAIDTVLRHIRKRFDQPFGGVQVLLIGDLFQLPPVVTNREQKLLETHYQSPFFFDAHVLQQNPPVCIELKKIYRQSEEKFINLLNKVRNNEVTEKDLEYLHQFYKPDFHPEDDENYITLTSHNNKARQINEKKLKELPGKVWEFEATVEGDFNENAFPADSKLQLKEGAQVMFIRNDSGEDRRYYNGKLATIKTINEEGIWVSFPEDEQGDLLLEKEEWKNIRYTYDEEAKSINEKELGSFHQYPVRLAWAITIHKSQGLTFTRAIIDAGSSFSSGQVYVALSRLTGVENLVLHSKIPRQSIHCHDEVQSFMRNKEENEEVLKGLLQKEHKAFIHNLLTNTFDWDNIIAPIQHHIADYREKQVSYQEEVVNQAQQWLKKAREQQQVANKFIRKLEELLKQGEEAYSKVHERIISAKNYFDPRLKEELFDPIEKQAKKFQEKHRVKKYIRALNELRVNIKYKKKQLEQAATLVEGLKKGEDSHYLLTHLDEQKKTDQIAPEPVKEKSKPKPKTGKPKKGESQQISLQMYKDGNSIDAIVQERGLAKSTIESHLVGFIKTGELSVYDYIPEEKIKTILPMVEKAENYNSSPIKNELGEDYSYNEVRAVINHWIWENGERKEKEV